MAAFYADFAIVSRRRQVAVWMAFAAELAGQAVFDKLISQNSVLAFREAILLDLARVVTYNASRH